MNNNNTNITNFSNYKLSKTSPQITIDKKLLCFYKLFKTMGINLNQLKFKNYSRPSIQYHSVVGTIANIEEFKKIDLKLNAIYNLLDCIKSKCDKLVDQKSILKLNYIILNIASQLFDNQFSKMKLDSTNVTDVIATIKWSKNNFYFNKLSIFYCIYANFDLKMCESLSNLHIESTIKSDELFYNIKLLSKDFINGLKEEDYLQIISQVMSENYYISQILDDNFYDYAKNFCDIDPNFFSKREAFYIFFSSNIIKIIDVFGIEKICKLSNKELLYISRYNSIKSLEEIKTLMNLDIPISKINIILNYPVLIKYIYEKIVTIKISLQKNQNLENPNKNNHCKILKKF